MTLSTKCFFSYSHDDAKRDKGVLSLFSDIRDEFCMITGEKLDTTNFVDRESIHLGDNWRKVISHNLEILPFFIPILTPSYFLSPYCTSELRTFLEKLSSNDSGEGTTLILPILYVKVPELYLDQPDNDLVKAIQDIQYQDWTELRFEERNSPLYRRAINHVAREIKDRNEKLERHPLVKEVTNTEILPGVREVEQDENIGVLDMLVEFQVSMEESAELLNETTDAMSGITNLINETGELLNSEPMKQKPLAVKLLALKSLARKLQEPVDIFYSKAELFAQKMSKVNLLLPDFIDFAASLDTTNSDQLKSVCSIKNSMISTNDNLKSLINSSEEAIKSSDSVGALTRELRPIIRKQNNGFNFIKEAAITFNQTAEIINTWDVDCSE